MSLHIHLSRDIRLLSSALAKVLRGTDQDRHPDPFLSPLLIVPNLNMKRWLQLELSRQNGTAMHLQFTFIEKAIEFLLGLLVGDEKDRVEVLHQPEIQLLILAALRGKVLDAEESRLWVDYLGKPASPQESTDHARRLWQLSSRLARHFQAYIFHRREMLDSWMNHPDEDFLQSTDDALRKMERSQKYLYRYLFAEGGLREQLQKEVNREFLTLPEYADRVWNTSPKPEQISRRKVHAFCLSQLSRFHDEALLRLSIVFDIHLYLLNHSVELWSGSPETLQARLAGSDSPLRIESTASGERLTDCLQQHPLVTLWGNPGRESVALLFDLLKSLQLKPEIHVPSGNLGESVQKRSLLAQLQEDIRHHRESVTRIPQDTSIQVLACPGIFREVEGVYQSILHNLHTQSDLKLTDMAVLVADMNRYRPVIEAVFNREECPILWNLSDSSAVAESALAEGMMLLLELADGDFNRQEVFRILRNPCIQRALGVHRQDIQTWLDWADALGIFRAFDQRDKYADAGKIPPEERNDLYTWKQGLQRLRLGRIMEPDKQGGDEGREFLGLVPFPCCQGNDADSMGVFSHSIERLAQVRALRDKELTWSEWKQELIQILDLLLAVPEDRPQEARVRNAFLEKIEQWHYLHEIFLQGGKEGKFGLPLLREWVGANLKAVDCRRGAYLTGGVTVSSFQPMRPIPFKIIYILGMQEGLFPGRPEAGSLDLRQARRKIGDLSAPDINRYLFLETLLSATEKLYLSHVSHDLQKDQPIYPCSVVNELLSHLEKKYLPDGKTFQTVQLPLQGTSVRYYQNQEDISQWTDALVNYSTFQRTFAVHQLKAMGKIEPSSGWNEAYEKEQAERCPLMQIPGEPQPSIPGHYDIRLEQLKAFLENPVQWILRRDLNLGEEEEEDLSLQNDEPLNCRFPFNHKLLLDLLTLQVRNALSPNQLEGMLDQKYRLLQSQSLLPEGVYGRIDCAELKERLRDMSKTLQEFLGQIKGQCLLVNPAFGVSTFSGVSDLRVPPIPIKLHSDDDLSFSQCAVLHGQIPFLWSCSKSDTAKALVLAPLSKTNKDFISRQALVPFLFYCSVMSMEDAPSEHQPLRELFQGKVFELNILCRNGLMSLKFMISEKDARNYLFSLVRDYIQPHIYDLLPYHLIKSSDLEGFRNNYCQVSDNERQNMRRQVVDSLEESIYGDNSQYSYRLSDLLKIVHPAVPTDALEKYLRRIDPIYQYLLQEESPRRRRK